MAAITGLTGPAGRESCGPWRRPSAAATTFTPRGQYAWWPRSAIAAGAPIPANGYPTIKALIDGMTDAGVWPDDDSEHVIGPDMRRATETPPKGFHAVTIRLEA